MRLARTERDEQILLVDWLTKCTNIPVIKIDNEGKRTPQGGALAKRMGLYPGASDLFLARPARGYHGLWVEMKSKTGRVTDTQLFFIDRMRIEGYQAIVFWDGQKAIDYIKDFYQI